MPSRFTMSSGGKLTYVIDSRMEYMRRGAYEKQMARKDHLAEVMNDHADIPAFRFG